jgi:hypothetical protein
MLWGSLMKKLFRFGPAALVAIASFAGLQCDPADEPPPATAQVYAGTPPPPPPNGAAGAPVAEGAPAEASGEVVVGAEADSYADSDPSALTDFHSTLDPYGTWVNDPTYGTVWAPSASAVGPDFQPYVSAGHWTYDNDWVWASDYSWGWAPFHYGRWVFVEGRGWVWIPGRVYRGAWVTWSVADDYGYIGWAPMAPAFIWWGGAAVVWSGPYIGPRWAYCPRGAVFEPGLHGRVLVGAAAAPIAPHMRMFVSANASVAAAGPAPQRLGYRAEQLPRPTGAAQAHILRAQQFARPSTAQALGGHPAASFAAPAAHPMGPGAAPVYRGGPAGASPAYRPTGPGAPPVTRGQMAPGQAPARSYGAPATRSYVAPAPAPRVAPAPRGGFGGGFGGGGHHR